MKLMRNLIIKKVKKKKASDLKYDELLTLWGLEKYTKNMEDEGWDDPKDWKELTDDDMKNEMNFSKGHIKKFRRRFDEWLKQIDQEKNNKPLKINKRPKDDDSD